MRVSLSCLSRLSGIRFSIVCGKAIEEFLCVDRLLFRRGLSQDITGIVHLAESAHSADDPALVKHVTTQFFLCGSV